MIPHRESGFYVQVQYVGAELWQRTFSISRWVGFPNLQKTMESGVNMLLEDHVLRSRMLCGANSLTAQGRCSVVFGLCYWRSVSSLLLLTLFTLLFGPRSV